MTSSRLATPTPEEMDALLQRAHALRAEAAARQFGALARLLRRLPAAAFGRRPRDRRRNGGCAQAA